MKKTFLSLCAAVMVLSASAAPEFATRASKKNIGELNATLPAVEYTDFSHNRIMAAPAMDIKKAPAVVSNGKIVAGGAQAMFFPASITGADALYEFDFFSGEDFAAYVVVKANNDSTKLAGTYSLTEGQVVVAAGDTTDVNSGSLAITYVAPNYHFALNAVCANGQTYTLELDYAASSMYAINYMLYYYYQSGLGSLMGINTVEDCLIELTDAPFIPTGKTIDVIIPGVSILTNNTADTEEPWFEISGMNDSYYVVLDIISNQVVGTYGKTDFDYAYTAIYAIGGDSETKIAVKEYDSNTATVTINGDTTIVDASVMGKDGNIYHVVMKYYIPTPTQSIDVTLTGTVDADRYAEYGLTNFEAADENYAISLLLECNGAGTYTMDDLNGMNSTQGSYLGDMQTKYIIDIVSANIVLAADNSFTAQFISTDARQFNITFTPSMTALSNTTADEAKALKVVRNGQLVIIKNGVEYNALGAQLQ